MVIHQILLKQLAGLRLDVDKLDIDELKTTPDDLNKLSDLVKIKLLQKMYMMNWLKASMLFRLLIY